MESKYNTVDEFREVRKLTRAELDELKQSYFDWEDCGGEDGLTSWRAIF